MTSRWACPVQWTASSSGCFWRRKGTIWGNCWMLRSIWCLSQTSSPGLMETGLNPTGHPDTSHTGSVRKNDASYCDCCSRLLRHSYLIASKIQTVDITIAMRFPSASAVCSANWEMLACWHTWHCHCEHVSMIKSGFNIIICDLYFMAT